MVTKKHILITGGAGFIGSNFILDWLALNKDPDTVIINLDKLTYAGNLNNLTAISDHPNYNFVKGDMGDRNLLKSLLTSYNPVAIINFAAESHVDNSISNPGSFIDTNIVSTFNLIDEVKNWWASLSSTEHKDNFRFIHISTDEVFGTLSFEDEPFTEKTQYAPNSPYSASKAASDHIVRAFHHTFGLPTITSNCSNNYGPLQNPEKLIPKIISNALAGKDLPVYGNGSNIRDWLFVSDHCSAIRLILEKGSVGETYNIGGNTEKSTLEVVNTICSILDSHFQKSADDSHTNLIKFVTDRPGHDLRYAINFSKLNNQLGWSPSESFYSGIRKTVEWYLSNSEWVSACTKENV